MGDDDDGGYRAGARALAVPPPAIYSRSKPCSTRNTIMSNLFVDKSSSVGRRCRVGMRCDGAGPGDRLADFWYCAPPSALSTGAAARPSRPPYSGK